MLGLGLPFANTWPCSNNSDLSQFWSLNFHLCFFFPLFLSFPRLSQQPNSDCHLLGFWTKSLIMINFFVYLILFNIGFALCLILFGSFF